MIQRRSLLAALLAPLAALLPKRSAAWDETIRQFSALEEMGQSDLPFEPVKVFTLHCNVEDAKIDTAFLRSVLGSVNATDFIGGKGTLKLEGVKLTRAAKPNGDPSLSTIDYELHHKPSGWSEDESRFDFNQLPLVTFTAEPIRCACGRGDMRWILKNDQWGWLCGNGCGAFRKADSIESVSCSPGLA